MVFCFSKAFGHLDAAHCGWLFSNLFEVEKRIGPIADRYQAKVFGFLSERMMNLLVHYQKHKVAH